HARLASAQAPPSVTSDADVPRMPRELLALVQRLSDDRPLVLFIDDVHWADPSTIDALANLAGRVPRWRVLVVVTCRPADLTRTRLPFPQLNLLRQARGTCNELRLASLTAEDTGRYIELEFATHRFPDDFARLIHASADGNPLFMVHLLRHLCERGVVAKTD